jgi:hypothetical protein
MNDSPSHDAADRVLNLKRKEREARACYPCRRRKVKCDGTQPCHTCQKRHHPEICIYDTPRDPRSESSRAASNAHYASSSPLRLQRPRRQSDHAGGPPASTSLPPDDAAKNYVYSGDNSVVSILRSRASEGNESITCDVGSVLGLQNTFSSYPFMDSNTPQERWSSLLTVLPHRTEVLKSVLSNVAKYTC